jgi:hypothetical protein
MHNSCTGRSLALFVRALSLVPLLATCTLAQNIENVPPKHAQELLKALIPANKKFVTLNAYVASTNIQDINLGTTCSSTSRGSTTGNVDENGNITANTITHGDTTCSDRHIYKHTMSLGFEDAADPKSAYLVTVQCERKWVWDHCDMPPEHSFYPVVLEAGKHGTFDIYAATSQKLGGKTKVAKFAVLDVSHVTKIANN